MNFKYLIISALIGLTMGCKDVKKGEENPCVYGKMTPVLNEKTSGVSEYQFNTNEEQGIETALLTDSVLLLNTLRFTLIQSGCEKVRQEFRFELPSNDYTVQPDSFFVQRIAEGLRVLSEKSLSAGQSFMPNFAYELYVSAGNVPMGERLVVDSETAPGVFFTINKIVGKNEGIVTIELESE